MVSEGKRPRPVLTSPSTRSPAHGFCDDEATRRLLRSRPPEHALQWAGSQLGGTVRSTHALRGGMSSAVHLLVVELPSGQTIRVVLRRYVRPELNDEEPDIAQREQQILQFVEAIEVPTPRLLAVDPTGADAGAPAVLMSRLSGRVDWWPRDMDRWLARLAELLPPIHAVGLPPPGVIRAFAPYRQQNYEPPAWARRPKVWERAVEIFHRPAPAFRPVFIHRDFHPGNVLWQRNAVSGIVDWQAASLGPASVDVAHCRANLFGYGIEVADRFTAVWEGITGQSYEPWAEVVGIVGFLDGLRVDPGSDRFVTEETLARAVADLG